MGYKKIITALKEKGKQGLPWKKKKAENIYSKHSFSEHHMIIALRYFHELEECFKLYRMEGMFYPVYSF